MVYFQQTIATFSEIPFCCMVTHMFTSLVRLINDVYFRMYVLLPLLQIENSSRNRAQPKEQLLNFELYPYILYGFYPSVIGADLYATGRK